MISKAQWETIHATRPIDLVGWYPTRPVESIALIRQSALRKTARIIDIGVGASSLIDFLLNDRFTNVTVLDISHTAIERAKARLGELASRITWIEADITTAALPVVQYDIWHDRSVFHFLTSPGDRHKYVETVTNSLKPGGHLILATVASDGPAQCSGLDVVRYSPPDLQREFGVGFELIDSCDNTYETPSSNCEGFIYCHFRKR
jgi:SAM-dependent methyltransferase